MRSSGFLVPVLVLALASSCYGADTAVKGKGPAAGAKEAKGAAAGGKEVKATGGKEVKGVKGAAAVGKDTKGAEEDGGFLSDLSERLDDVLDDAADALDAAADVLDDAAQEFKERAEAVFKGMGDLWDDIKDGAEAVADTVSDAIEDMGEALGFIAVDEVENKVERFMTQTALVRNVVGQGLIGSAMMLWGVHFSQTIILAHTIRVTGWPILKTAFNDLIFFYRKAREAIRKEFPNLKKAKEILEAVKFETAALRRISMEAAQQRQKGKLSSKDATAIIRQAEVDLRQLHKKSYVLNQAVSSVSALTGALDVGKLKDIFKGVYTSILACLAAGSSATVRKLSIGFDLAGIISKHLDHIFQSLVHQNTIDVFKALPQEAQKLLGVLVSMLSVIKGLLVVRVVVPKMSLSISSSALGAAWVSNALVEVSDARAGGAGKGLFNDKTLYMLTHVALTLTGVIFQANVKELPGWVEKALLPFVKSEEFLRTWEWGAFKKKKAAEVAAGAPAS